MAQFLNEAMMGDGGVSGTASDTIDWPGGPGVFMSQGTYNGATFQLQYQVDGSSWSDVPGAEATHTDNDIGSFQLCPCKLRVLHTAGDASTDVHLRIAPSWQGWWNDPNELPST